MVGDGRARSAGAMEVLVGRGIGRRPGGVEGPLLTCASSFAIFLNERLCPVVYGDGEKDARKF